MEFENTCYSQYSGLYNYQHTNNSEDKKPFELFDQNGFIKDTNSEKGCSKPNHNIMSGSDTDTQSKKKRKKNKQNTYNWKCDETLMPKSEILDDSQVITQEVEIDKAFLEQISQHTFTDEEFYVKLQKNKKKKKKKHDITKELNGSALESLEEFSDRNETEGSSVISENFEAPDFFNKGIIKKRENKKKHYGLNKLENVKVKTENSFEASEIEENSDNKAKQKKCHRSKEKNVFEENVTESVANKMKSKVNIIASDTRVDSTEYSSEDSAVNKRRKKKRKTFASSENEVRARKIL